MVEQAEEQKLLLFGVQMFPLKFLSCGMEVRLSKTNSK